MAASSLGFVLSRYKGDYSPLFTPGQNLQFNEKKQCWEISRQPITKRNQQDFFKKLAYRLTDEDLSDVPHVQELIQRINSVWIQAQEFLSEPNHESDSIHFSSRVQGYHFLSNFFPTLIVHDGKLFFSAEHLYQYLVTTQLQPDTDHYSNIKHLPAEKVRNYSSTIQKAQVKTGQDKMALRKAKVVFMETVVVPFKFDQNPLLKAALMKTAPHSLVEATTNAFWGTGSDGKGANQLGKILVHYRTECGG